MVIQPKIRGFICTTAHPDGCAKHVEQQIEYAKNHKSSNGPKNVLVIGSSTGFGLASRIFAAFGCGAATIGISFEKPADEKRTATAGWYNTVAFDQAAHRDGIYSKSINGDAFSNEIKQQVINLIKQDLGQVDLVVYSIAAPKRTHPITGETFVSALKPIGKSCTNKSVNTQTGVISEVTTEPATEDEIRQTVAVMGGEDWEMWIKQLHEAGALAPNAKTVAYSYIGPALNYDIYRDGTIGQAKEDLESTALRMDEWMRQQGGHAYVSVNKALVTQSSSAIPAVPLYIALLFRVMKEKGLHEDCIEQMTRLFNERLYIDSATPVDEKGRIRIDDWEMREDVQAEVSKLWEQVSSETVEEISDLEGYRTDFLKLFGFGLEGVDYDADVDPAR